MDKERWQGYAYHLSSYLLSVPLSCYLSVSLVEICMLYFSHEIFVGCTYRLCGNATKCSMILHKYSY